MTESIFGDILEENETEEEEIVVRQDGSMLVEASMNLDDFMEAMGIMNYDDLKEEDFTTLSGLAMFLIGRVPKAGDLFSYKKPGLRSGGYGPRTGGQAARHQERRR